MKAHTAPPCPSRSGIPLAQEAYYGIGGSASWLVSPRSAAELAAVLLWAHAEKLPLALLGKGSNLLFSDEPFPGAVLTFEGLSTLSSLGDGRYWCEAGVSNARLAEALLSEGRTGGEWLAALPGSIGGTVRMNARCFGGEVSEVVEGALVLTLDGRLLWRRADALFLGYKQTSLMRSREVVVGALMRFPHEESRGVIERRMAELAQERERKHHFDFPSCGSTFRNNYDAGRSSGSIFEELGFKGAREGGAAVSAHHANFIYNLGGATAADVLRLSARMRQAALERAGVALELEVECVGRFDRKLLERCGVSSRQESEDPSMGWAGLLRYPGEEEPRVEEAPVMLLEGPLLAYGTAPAFHAGTFVQVEQLQSLSGARREPRSPLLRWRSRFAAHRSFMPAPPSSLPAGSFVDDLWHYGVSELFVASGDDSGGYIELEVTAEGHWLAIAFDAPRQRSVGHELPASVHWIGGIEVERGEGEVSLTLSYELLRPLIAEGRLRLQCAASAREGRLGLMPPWNDPPDPPDFHRPERFIPVELF